MTSTDLPGDPSDTPQEELMLPGFVSIRPEGVIIDLRALALVIGGFELFVNRLFAGGMRFSGLDYAAFLKLLYDADWPAAMQGQKRRGKNCRENYPVFAAAPDALPRSEVA